MSAPIFARRHYCAVAGVIRDADYLDAETRGRLIGDFSSLFAGDNGRFQPDRFQAAACDGVQLVEPLASRRAPELELSEQDRLEARGYRDGHAVATWFTPQDEEAARRVLNGI